MITVFIEFFTVISFGFFAGACLYISLVEVPARKALGGRAAILAWREFVPRALFVLKNSGFIGMGLGLLCFLLSFKWFWLAATLTTVSLGPYTAKMLAPTNNRLLDPALDLDDPESFALTDLWGKRHAVRSVITMLAFIFALIAY